MIMMEIVRKRQRFTDHDDLALLREVLGQNPFEDAKLWEVIQENIFSLTGKQFSIRTLKDHLELLIKLWLEQFKVLKDKSGIEVIRTEKQQLCESIYEMMQEFSVKKRKTSDKNTKIRGIEARNKSAEELSRTLGKTRNVVEEDIISDGYMSVIPTPLEVNVTVSNEKEEDIDVGRGSHEVDENLDVNSGETGINAAGPSFKRYNLNAKINAPEVIKASRPLTVLGAVRSRKRKINTQRQGLAYLEQYDAQQLQLKQKEQELEEKKLNIEERKITLLEKHFTLIECEMKKNVELVDKKINSEREERATLHTIIEKQNLLLNLLVNKLT